MTKKNTVDMDNEKKSNNIEKVTKRESRTRSQTRRISDNKYQMKMKNTKSRDEEKTQSNESLASDENEDFDTKLINLKNSINETAEEHKVGKIITLNNRMFRIINKKLTDESKVNEIKELNKKIGLLENENEGLKTKIKLDNERMKHICDENDDQINEYSEKINDTKKEIKNMTSQITHFRAKIYTMEMETEEMQNERARLEIKIEKLMEENVDSKNVITILQKTID